MKVNITTKKGGGKLSRSQAVSVRLDPKLKHGAEMAARYQRRTLSSFIEWAVEHSLENLSMDLRNNNYVSFSDLSDKTYDVYEQDKLVKLASSYPNLLNHDERIIWKIIETHKYFMVYHSKDGGIYEIPFRNFHHYVMTNIREQWDNIIAITEGGEDKIPDEYGELTEMIDTSIPGDIPF